MSLNKYHIVENEQKSMNQTDVSRGPGDNTIKERLCGIETVETNDYSTRPNVRSNLGKSKNNSERTGKCQRETSYLKMPSFFQYARPIFLNALTNRNLIWFKPKLLLFVTHHRKVFMQIMKYIFWNSYFQQLWKSDWGGGGVKIYFWILIQLSRSESVVLFI